MFKKGEKVITKDGRKGVYMYDDGTGVVQHWVKLCEGEDMPHGSHEPFFEGDLKSLEKPKQKPKTKFKVGDKVKFKNGGRNSVSGVGVVVDVGITAKATSLVAVHHKDIQGHSGTLGKKFDNNRNWNFLEGDLTLVKNPDLFDIVKIEKENNATIVELELVTGDTPVNTSNPFNIVKIEKGNNVTIVEFEDGSKTQVVKDKNDVDSLYSAVAAALAKKVYGSNSQFKSQIAKAYKIEPKHKVGDRFEQGVAIEIVEANGDFYYVLDNYGTIVMHKESELIERATTILKGDILNETN